MPDFAAVPDVAEDPADRLARLRALETYAILDTGPEQGFDDIVRLAASLCAAPVALVSLVAQRRQWFKARLGLDVCETPIEQSVCWHALRQAAPTIIPDLRCDPRTAANALVTAPPHLRFYAGAPIMTPQGVAVGTVCVIDTEPRPAGLAPAQVEGLQALARQAATMLEMRRLLGVQRTVLAAEQQKRTHAHDAGRRARLANEAGGIGTFQRDPGRDRVALSPEACRLFGLPVAPEYPAARLDAQVLAEDRPLSGLGPNPALADPALADPAPADPDSASAASANLVSADPARADPASAAPALADEARFRVRRADDGQVRWIERRSRLRATPDGGRELGGTLQDVTETHLAALRIVALVELGDALRDATSVEQVVATAARLIGRALSSTRAGFAMIDARQGQFVVDRDWTSAGAHSISGRHSVALFPATYERLLRGETVHAADIPATPWLAPDQGFYASVGVRAMIRVPLLVHGELVAVLFVHEGAPRRWSQDELGFVRSVADRTYAAVAKVRAEAEQKLLNLELSHRLKNTMAMVQAIAGQTLRAAGDREAVRAFERRLHALGTAHDVLLHGNWSAAPIAEVISSALRPVADETRFTLAGPPIELDPRACLSLSLLSHELATNAVKHGALSNETGRVAVAWRIEGQDASAMLVLDWQERGGPPARPGGRTGLGSKLIRAGLLGSGGTEIRFTPAGFEASFTAPLARMARG